MSRRWRYPRSRRGDFYPVIPSSAPPAAPSYTPVFQEPSGRNSRPRVVRRGRFYTVPSVGVVAGQSPLPPSFQRPTTRRLVAPRRGEYLSVPKVGQALAAPTPPPPTFTRPRVRIGVTRRGEFSTPVPQQAVQITVWVPQFARTHRAPVISVRRGRYSVVLPARATCPLGMRSRRTAVLMRRRGQMWMPSWVYVPPPPPPPVTAGTAHAATGSASDAFAATASAATASSATDIAATASAATGGAASASSGAMTVPKATGG